MAAALLAVLLACMPVSAGAASHAVAAEAEPMDLVATRSAPRQITVGVYENRPKIFRGADGRARGFFPEIVDRLAKRLNWRVNYVPCAWQDCLAMVRRGEIDIMPDVARFPERESQFRFGGEAVLQSWSYILTRRSSPRAIGSIDDLDGLSVAVMEASAQARELRYLAEARSLEIGVLEQPSFAAVLDAVRAGTADIGVVNSFYARANASGAGLSIVPVLFQPTALYFVYSPGVAARLINRVDTQLALMKADPASAYYAAIDRWLKPKPLIDAERWLIWAAMGAVILLAISLVANSHLRRVVARRTAALRESQNRLKAIFDHAPVEIYLKDREGRYVEVNRQFERLFNKRSEDVVGLLPADVHDPGLAERTRAHDIAILETGDAIVREEKAETELGTRYLHTVKFPIFDGEGRVDGIGAVVSDVTQQREAQAKALEVERRLAEAVDALPVGFVLFDADDRLVMCNARYRELYGNVDVERLTGRTFEEILRDGVGKGLHPDAVGQEEAWIAERLETHRQPESSFEQRLPGDRWLRVVERRTGDGGTVGFRIDISDLKAHERALDVALAQAEETAERLREQTWKLAEVVEISGVGGWDLDLETGVLSWDPTTRKIHGVGKDFQPDLKAALGFYKQKSRPLIEAAVRDCIDRLHPFDVEIELLTVAGQEKWARATGRPVVEQGRAVRLTGAFRDVTAQKTHERALEEARLEAEKANVAKSQFLANMSHEIRTPMNGVTGMLALLLHSDLGERQRQQAQTAYDSAAGLMRVLNDILDYSKLEANALQLEHIEYQPRQVIDEVIGMLAPQAAEKGIALTSSLDPAVPGSLMGDPVRLRQILVNLAGNAVKFTETGSVRIGGRLEGREPGWVRFTVTDTGPGIPAEVQGRLFTRFAQADESIMRRHGGTGLGLAISKQLVEAFGGQIGVISRPEEGSRFWFTIPAERPKSNVRPIQLRSVATTRHAG